MNLQPGQAKYIIVIGIIIVIIGVILVFNKNAFSWFGKLPGDVRIEKENFKFYFPFGTMLLISIIITLIVNVLKKLF